MKIRTITTGFNLALPLKEKQLKQIADFASHSRNVFEESGYQVQTVRITTQPWEEYFTSRSQIVRLARELEDFTQTYAIDFFNVGPTTNLNLIPQIYHMIGNTTTLFCTALISDEKRIDYDIARRTATLIKKLSTIGEDGFSNLRFAALCNTKPGGAFFPAAYHKGADSFAIGTENSDLVYRAFSRAGNIEDAGRFLREILMEEFSKVERIAGQISREKGMKYEGIDVSIATSVQPEESIAYAFEQLKLGKFGEVGTLSIAKLVTDTVRNLEIKKCGYSGLMLPILEDYGLAMRNIDESFTLTDLLLYSSVCGTGLDTIPLPGDIAEEKLYALLLDIASIAIKLDKPLSARLMPVPNKKTGELTDYNFEYFENSRIMDI